MSAASPKARKALRAFPYLIEALACYLGQAVSNGLFEVRSVENVVCILRNLSYRFDPFFCLYSLLAELSVLEFTYIFLVGEEELSSGYFRVFILLI